MPPGYLLRNRYRIENRLAAGGFGETYIAVDEDYPNKRRVVVKHLQLQSNDPAVLDVARRLFESEGVTLAQLGEKTDRIPTLYAYFEENREFYLVQELIEGQTLTLELGTQKLSEAATLEIVREILAVLTEVHTNKIVHRDLKPDNIIRRSSDRKLVLIDFGAVKAVRQTILHASGPKSIGIGTAGYMPTEQAMGYPTAASDIYAVGAIALQCLTGKLPSDLFDEDAMELRWQHLCSVSDRVANILAKMVAARHLDRYPNAMEAIKAIDSLLTPIAPAQSIPTIPFPAPSPQPPAQPARSTVPQTPATIKLTQQVPPAPVRKQIDRHKSIKWAAIIGCSGLIGAFVLSKLINPSKIPSAGLIAATQSSSKDLQSALDGYDLAIKNDPNNANAYFNRGFFKKTKIQDFQGALADYDRAIQLNPDYALAYGNRAILKYEQLKDDRGALIDYDRAIKIDPNYANAYHNRGLLKQVDDSHKPTEALADYNRAIQLNPDYALAYYNRGLLKDNKLSDRTGAINDLKQAAKLYQAQGSQQSYKDATEKIKIWEDLEAKKSLW
jgi:serine/threonine protein kinase